MSVQRMAQEFAFEASHFYQLPHLSPEENARLFGNASHPHGHNYRVRVCYTALPETPLALWEQIAHIVRDLIDTEVDHRCLNAKHPSFQQHLPTIENLAIYLWHALHSKMPIPIEQVEVLESEMLASAYTGEPQPLPSGQNIHLVSLTRAYSFSCAHRLYNPQLSEAENRAHFGKCANPYGHDYRLEVTVRGPVDPTTGMVLSLAELDALVQKEIPDMLDHRYLNEEVPSFDQIPPTSENLVAFIMARLTPHFPHTARLVRVRLHETPRSYFEWEP